MAVTIASGAGTASTTIYTNRIPNRGANLQQSASTSFAAPISPLLPQIRPLPGARRMRMRSLTLRFVMMKDRESGGAWSSSEADAIADKLVDLEVSRGSAAAISGADDEDDDSAAGVGVTVPNLAEDYERQISALRLAEKLARKKSERFTYLIAAVMSSFGITSMAVMAVYCRFSWQMEGQEIPMTEMFGTFALSVGAAVGMEFWARWAHKALWHASLWHMHESHHKPREGPFELNDVFAIVNSIPAIALLSYGFFHKGFFPGLCFGAGLGITVFGMAYMFVHDGLVHKRFPVGPIANVPYFRKVAAAHQLHHSEKFNGVPYGLFLGPQELEEVGGQEELEKEISRRIKMYKQQQQQSPPSG